MFDLPHSTLSDVAVLANTSKESVARVMLGKSGVPLATQRRILDAIHILNDPKKLADDVDTSRVIGVVVPTHLAHDSYTAKIARGIAHKLQDMGYRMMFHIHSEEQGINYYDILLRNKLANGFIVQMPQGYKNLFGFCERYQIPHVLIDHWAGHDVSDKGLVIADNHKGAMEAMQHLIGLGHRRIAHLAGKLHIAGAVERLEGYKDALSEAGLPYDPALVTEAHWERSLGLVQTRDLLRIPSRPTAIFASDDISALGAVEAIKEAGLRVGSDVSVVGFDGLIKAEKCDPPLTTLEQPAVDMGMTAAEMIVTLMQGQSITPLHRVFAPKLIVRASTGAPAG